jgi:spermidine synthase
LLQEIDRQETPLGALVLRRRRLPGVEAPVTEVLLDGAYLMSSLVNRSEVLLAKAALATLPDRPLDVLVGGLGLGCTAAAVLEDPRTRRLVVVERLPAVIGWHRRGVVPLGRAVADDPRTTLVEADFFRWLGEAEATWDAILVDIDHSPRAHLAPAHAGFYEVEGLRTARRRLAPGGVFALWSADAPDGEFLARLDAVFDRAGAETVEFENPSVSATDLNTVYLAHTEARP